MQVKTASIACLLGLIIGQSCTKGPISPGESGDDPNSVSLGRLPKEPTPSPTGILDWQKCIGTRSDEFGKAVAKNDFGYLVVGSNNQGQDAYVQFVHNDRTLAPKHLIAYEAVDQAIGVAVKGDGSGSFLVFGYTNSHSMEGHFGEESYNGFKMVYPNNLFVAEYSATGEFLRINALGEGSLGMTPTALLQTSDGFVVTGYQGPNLFLARLDMQGAVINSRSVSFANSKGATGYGITETADAYIAAGRTINPDNTSNIIVVKFEKTDLSTAEPLQKVLDIPGTSEIAWDITSRDGSSVATSNNQLVITGGGTGNLFVFKLDHLLNIVGHIQEHGGSGTGERGTEILRTANGYVIAGFTNSRDGGVQNHKGGNDLWVLRLNEDLSLVNNVSYALGGSKGESAGGLIANGTDGFVAVGTTESNTGDVVGNNGGQDMWLVKFTFK